MDDPSVITIIVDFADLIATLFITIANTIDNMISNWLALFNDTPPLLPESKRIDALLLLPRELWAKIGEDSPDVWWRLCRAVPPLGRHSLLEVTQCHLRVHFYKQSRRNRQLPPRYRHWLSHSRRHVLSNDSEFECLVNAGLLPPSLEENRLY